jgi:hypothetical protein
MRWKWKKNHVLTAREQDRLLIAAHVEHYLLILLMDIARLATSLLYGDHAKNAAE